MVRTTDNLGREAEQALVQRVLAGERELFYQLIHPYERAVYLSLISMLKNAADAEDAAQEAMLKAYRSLHLFRGEAKFSTWLMTIALNEGRTRLGKLVRRQESSLDEEAEEHGGDFTPALLTDWRPVPNEVLEQKELASKLESEIQALPEKYREVFTLRDVEGLEAGEVAALLQVSPNVVSVRLHRARAMMQKRLAPVLKSYAVPQRRSWFGRSR
jgi:RNA polymerase sigma-70 factor, ECF subfamily